MSKTFSITAFGETYQVYVNIRQYSNGRPAIELIDAEDHFPYAVATVNMPDVLLMPNEVLVKDYSENEGMLEFLTVHNIVTPTENGVHSGHVWLPVAVLNPDTEWKS